MISIKLDDFTNNYDLFVKLCEMTAEPIRLACEGKPDMIVMNAEAFERRRKTLDLREKLLRKSEEDAVTDISGHNITLEELGKYIDEVESGA